jgi:hypothetical protein
MSLHRNIRSMVIILGAGLLAISLISGAGTAKYSGQAKCKTCHLKQHKVWRVAKHANALETLPEKDRTNPECLACHTTGYGKTAAEGVDLAGVQCEACHGPGSVYKSMKIMSKKAYRADPAAAHQKAVEAGLIIPDKTTCLRCHNDKSPTFKGFDEAAMMEKIKHWE